MASFVTEVYCYEAFEDACRRSFAASTDVFEYLNALFCLSTIAKEAKTQLGQDLSAFQNALNKTIELVIPAHPNKKKDVPNDWATEPNIWLIRICTNECWTSIIQPRLIDGCIVEVVQKTYQQIRTFFNDEVDVALEHLLKKYGQHNLARYVNFPNISAQNWTSLKTAISVYLLVLPAFCPLYKKIVPSDSASSLPKRMLEKTIADREAIHVQGHREIKTRFGRIDVISNEEIIEIKIASGWKHALGQILAYGMDHPKKRKRIHLFGDLKRWSAAKRRQIEKCCSKYDVEVSYELI
jgi:hypothetical protein